MLPVITYAQTGSQKTVAEKDSINKLMYVITETEHFINLLEKLERDDRVNESLFPRIGNGDFFLTVNTKMVSKGSNGYFEKASYTIHVMPDKDNLKLKIRLDMWTFYEDGVYVGHGEPSGKWEDCDDFCYKVIDYYRNITCNQKLRDVCIVN